MFSDEEIHVLNEQKYGESSQKKIAKKIMDLPSFFPKNKVSLPRI